jgi:hypothetical protein
LFSGIIHAAVEKFAVHCKLGLLGTITFPLL